MKNAVIYLVNNHENCLSEEESGFNENATTLPDVKVTGVYLEETPENREQLMTKLCAKVDKGEVQIILTNSFAFAFCVERYSRLLADKINEYDIEVYVGTNLSFDNPDELTCLRVKES